MSDLMAGAVKFFQQKFDGIIRIEVDGQQALWIDGRLNPPIILGKAPAQLAGGFCLWQSTPEALGRIFSDGPRQLEVAYIAGRLTISGDMAVMARLESGCD